MQTALSFLSTLLLIGALGAGETQLFASEYYVSTVGLDTNPGTLGQPWRTVQKAANTVVAGDVVHIRAGTYAERVTLSNRDGTAALPIVFQKYAPDAGAAVIDQTGVTPPNGTSALLWIENCDYITIQGVEFANYQTMGTNMQKRNQLPAGIFITGDGNGIRLINCRVHDIWQTNDVLYNFNANAFGIAVYGTSSTAIDNLTIDGCEVYNLRTGASESVVLNGNVTNFTVTNNTVHDCNNIGIDFIGYEGANATVALDRARNGVCAGNTVYNIDSAFNPAYGGNFSTGGGDRSAPGVYVDGGQSITIERNLMHHCNYGASAGSEHSGKFSDGVVLRSNIIHHCHVGGIVLGGSGGGNGGATNVTINNNTLYLNDTDMEGGGCIEIQNFVSTTTIKNNIMVAVADGGGWGQFVLKTNTNGSFSSNAIDWNLYSGTSAADNLEFIWNDSSQESFSDWKAASGQDTHSTFTTASLGFANASGGDFNLVSTAIARDAGDTTFVAAPGEKDFGGQGRVANARVDIGADEFMTGWQAWRDLHFGMPDGGTNANANDDPDHDQATNLMEYSQGMNPNLPDAHLLPTAGTSGANFRFTYRKAAGDVTCTVQQNTTLPGTWITLNTTESTDDLGLFWRESPLNGAFHFFRLLVTLP